MKLNTSGAVQYATYLDISNLPGVGNNDIAVDTKGQAWVVGTTCPFAGGPTCNLEQGFASAIRKLDANGTTLRLDTRLFLLSQRCESIGARKADTADTVCNKMRLARQLPASATWAIWKTVIARSIQMSVRERSQLQVRIEEVVEQVVFRTNHRLRQPNLGPDCIERRSAGGRVR
jgi:hypothetical protein